MSTLFITGQPRAGKTSLCVEREMIPWFRDGGIIVTNIPLKRERWVQEFGEEAVADRLIIYPVGKWPDLAFSSIKYWTDHFDKVDKNGRGPKFVIDEAHKVAPKEMAFPIKDKKTSMPDMDAFGNQLLQLLTDQGHLLINNVFITQDPWNVSPRLHAQMHASLYVENAEYKGKAGGYTVKHWNRKLPRNYDQPGAQADDFEKIPKKYNPETWEFYKSQSMRATESGLVGRAAEGKFQRSRSIWKRPVVWLAAGGMGLAAWQAGSLVQSKTAAVEHAKGSQEANAGVTEETPSKPPQNPSTGLSDREQGVQAFSDVGAAEDAIEDGTDDLRDFRMRLLSATWKLPDGRIVPLVLIEGEGLEPRRVTLGDLASTFPKYNVVRTGCSYDFILGSKTVRRLYDDACLAGDVNNANRNTQNATQAGTAGAVRQAPFDYPGAPGQAPGRPDGTAPLPVQTTSDPGLSGRIGPAGSVG